MAKIGVFDLCSFFWTVAGTRKRGEDPYGLALQVLRYIRSCAEKVGVEDVIFGADGPSGRSFRRSVCPDYKAGREAKDPEHRAELDALTTALLDAGFTVHKAQAGEYVVDGVDEQEPRWFEGDDIVASFAVTILRDPDSEVFVGSNDWDLAPLLAFPKVRLFATRGEERTAADVKREFGVEPLMLPQLKALAGDSDGYKPFPGLEKGKPGIGDKTAAAILEKFGSAEAAVRAALADLPSTAFEGLPSRTAALLKAGGEAALAMGLTCAKLRTDAQVPAEIGFGEWAEVEAALLGRQKAQQSEPRPEVAPPTADTAKAFREAAHGQLNGYVERVEVKGRIGDFSGDGAVPDLIGRPRDPKGLGVSEIAPAVTPLEFAKAAARLEYGDGSTVPIMIDVTPVCPRCLGFEHGKPAGDPKHPHPGPFTAEVCANCAVVVAEMGPCPDGKCEHTLGDHVSDGLGCAIVGCPCMHEDNPNASKSIAATPLSLGRPIEAFRDNPVTAEDEERVVPRKRRPSKAAPTITIAQDFAGSDPDKVAAAFKEGVEAALEKPREVAHEQGETLPDFSPADLDGLARKRGWVPTEPKVFVLLTEAEFIALTPLPALAAAGLLTPPEDFADKFYSLVAALREGLLRPRDGVFIGSVPEACARGLSELSAVASCVMNGLEVLQSWRAFVEQLHVLPRLTDLAKYGGKLVRA